MSVVNTMLRELAERNNAGQPLPSSLHSRIDIAPTPAHRRLPWWFLALLVLAVLILIWRLWSATTVSVDTTALEHPVSTAASNSLPAEPSPPTDASTELPSHTPAKTAITPNPTQAAPSRALARAATANTAVPTPADAVPAAERNDATDAPASIGWELVTQDAERDSDWPAESPPDWPHQTAEPASSSDVSSPATTAATQTLFERAPAQLTRAEQLEQFRAQSRSALNSGDLTAAKQAIDNGLQLQRDDAPLQLLQLEWLAGQSPEQAVQHARQQLLNQPDNWAMRQWLGAHYLQQQQALLAQETLLTHAPSVITAPDYHGVLALAEQQSGAHQAAAQRYRQLIQLQPQHGRHWAGLALSEESLAQRAEAIHAWRQALHDPALPAALARFGQQRLQQLLTSAPTSQVSP